MITLTISAQLPCGFYINGSQEVWFIIFIAVLNLSAWSYLKGTITGLFVAVDERLAKSHESMSSVVRFIQNNSMAGEVWLAAGGRGGQAGRLREGAD